MAWPFIFINLMKVFLGGQISLPLNVLLHGLIEVNSIWRFNSGLFLIIRHIKDGWGKRGRGWVELIPVPLKCITTNALSIFRRFLIGRISVHEGWLTWFLLDHELRMVSLYREACSRINHFLRVVLNDKDLRFLSSRSLNHVPHFYTLRSPKCFSSIARISFNNPAHGLGGIVAYRSLTFPSSLVQISERFIRALHLICSGSNLHLLQALLKLLHQGGRVFRPIWHKRQGQLVMNDGRVEIVQEFILWSQVVVGDGQKWHLLVVNGNELLPLVVWEELQLWFQGL